MNTLVREILRDHPYVLIRGGDSVTLTDGGQDVSGNGRHGNYNGTGHPPHPGPRGAVRSTHLDQTNALTIPSAELPAMTGSSTLSVWLKGTYSSTNDLYQAFSRGLNRFLCYWNRPTSGKVTCYWGANNEGEALVSAGQTLWNDGRWHQWTWIRDTAPATPLLSIYVDGRFDTSRNEAGAAPLTGGDLLTSTGSTGVPLMFACVAAWDRVLSPARIKAQYRAGMGLRHRAEVS